METLQKGKEPIFSTPLDQQSSSLSRSQPVTEPLQSEQVDAQPLRQEQSSKYFLRPATSVEYVQSPQVQRRENPPIVRERVFPLDKVEVVPVIERERETVEIHPVMVVKRETVESPTTLTEESLPSSTIEFREMGQTPQVRWAAPQRFVEPKRRETVELPPIVRETVIQKVLEEVQPVIEREVLETHVIRAIRPIYEKIIENPRIVQESSSFGGGMRQPIAATSSLQGQQGQPQTGRGLEREQVGESEYYGGTSGQSRRQPFATTTSGGETGGAGQGYYGSEYVYEPYQDQYQQQQQQQELRPVSSGYNEPQMYQSRYERGNRGYSGSPQMSGKWYGLGDYSGQQGGGYRQQGQYSQSRGYGQQLQQGYNQQRQQQYPAQYETLAPEPGYQYQQQPNTGIYGQSSAYQATSPGHKKKWKWGKHKKW